MRIVKKTFFSLLLTLPLLANVAFANAEHKLTKSIENLFSYMSPEREHLRRILKKQEREQEAKEKWLNSFKSMVSQAVCEEEYASKHLNELLDTLERLVVEMNKLDLDQETREELFKKLNAYVSYMSSLNMQESLKKKLFEAIATYEEKIFALDLERNDQEQLFAAPTFRSFEELLKTIRKGGKGAKVTQAVGMSIRREFQECFNEAKIQQNQQGSCKILLDLRKEMSKQVYDLKLNNSEFSNGLEGLYQAIKSFLNKKSVQALTKDQLQLSGDGLISKIYQCLVNGSSLAFEHTTKLIPEQARDLLSLVEQGMSMHDLKEKLEAMPANYGSHNPCTDDSLSTKKHGSELLGKSLQDASEGILVFVHKLEQFDLDKKTQDTLLEYISKFIAFMNQSHVATSKVDNVLDDMKKFIASLEGITGEQKNQIEQLWASLSNLKQATVKNPGLLFSLAAFPDGCFSQKELTEIESLLRQFDEQGLGVKERFALFWGLSVVAQKASGTVSERGEMISRIWSDLESYKNNFGIPPKLMLTSLLGVSIRKKIKKLFSEKRLAKKVLEKKRCCENRQLKLRKSLISTKNNDIRPGKGDLFSGKYSKMKLWGGGAAVIAVAKLALFVYLLTKLGPSESKTLTGWYARWTHAAVVFTVLAVVLAGVLYYRYTREKRLGKS